MMRIIDRPIVHGFARAANVLFFLSTTAYCLVAYSPFGYQQFLKPQVLAWIPDFLDIHVAVYWLVLLMTLLTLKPFLQVRLKPDPTTVSGVDPTTVSGVDPATVSGVGPASAGPSTCWRGPSGGGPPSGSRADTWSRAP